MSIGPRMDQRYGSEKRLAPLRLLAWAALALAGIAYLFRLFPSYDWRLGLLSAVAFALGGANVVSTVRRWRTVLSAPHCPVCGGLLIQSDRVVMESIWLPEGSTPPIIDRTAKCEACAREHHTVFADKQQLGAFSSNRGLTQVRLYVESDRGLWPEYEKQWATQRPTRAMWEAKLRELQLDAENKNRTQGMTWHNQWRNGGRQR